MFPLEASGKPGRDYPRIGPTTSQPCSIDAGGNIFLQGGGNTNNVSNQKGAHTNTAARNQPRLLLAGRGSESGRANHHLSTVVCRRKKRSARGTPNTGTSGSKGNNSRLNTAGGHRGDGRLDTADGDHWGGGSLDTVVGRHQGANVLRHAGGILRCRSVYHASGSSHTPAPRSRSSINNSVADIIDTTTTAAAVVARDNKPKLLRAYSAPLFLHSTSFPPKSRAHSACGIKAPATTTGGDDDGRTTSSRIIRNQTPAAASNHGSCCGSRAQTSPHGDNEKRRQENNNTSAGAVAVAVAAAGAGAGAGGGAGAGAGAAPCRHRRRGYLHRYMGFVQEKVSSPPLESFRALGGLRDFPLKKESSASAAVVGRKLAGHDNAAAATAAAAAAAAAASVNPATEEAAATPEPPGGDRRCSLSNNSSERSYGGRQCSAVAAGGGGGDGPSGTTPVSPKEACPLELLADGSSSLAPITPPNNAVQIIPAWCSRSKKKRPEGANWQKKSWEADSRRGSSHLNRDAPKNKPTGSSSLVASLVACKSKTRRKKRAGSPYLVGVLLPYDLERPVSPERAEAFHYTCN